MAHRRTRPPGAAVLAGRVVEQVLQIIGADREKQTHVGRSDTVVVLPGRQHQRLGTLHEGYFGHLVVGGLQRHHLRVGRGVLVCVAFHLHGEGISDVAHGLDILVFTQDASENAARCRLDLEGVGRNGPHCLAELVVEVQVHFGALERVILHRVLLEYSFADRRELLGTGGRSLEAVGLVETLLVCVARAVVQCFARQREVCALVELVELLCERLCLELDARQDDRADVVVFCARGVQYKVVEDDLGCRGCFRLKLVG